MPTNLVTREDTREQNRKVLMIIFAIIGFPLAIAIGVEFEAPLPGSPNHFGSLFLNRLSVLGLLLAIDCIRRAEGARLFTAALFATMPFPLFRSAQQEPHP